MAPIFDRLLGRRRVPAHKPLNNRHGEKLTISFDSKKKLLDPYLQKN